MDIFIIMLTNGLITAGFSPFLIKIYQQNKKKFYLYWGAGFLLYGINIIIRAFINSEQTSPTPILWAAFACYMSGFTLIITGNGRLLGNTKMWLASSAAIILIPITVYLLSGPAALGWAATLSPYFLTSISLYFIKRRYPVSLDTFILGWLTLFAVNLTIPLNLIRPDYVEILAIIAKIIIFLGMISPKFSLIEADVKRFLISGFSKEYPIEGGDHLILINPGKKMRSEEIKWIKEKLKENSENGVRTILISLYDLITPSDIGSEGHGEDLYIVRMKLGGNHDVQVFKDNVTTINDDWSQFNFFLTDVIAYSSERNLRCDIILYSLSWIIHSHGWKQVYSQFITMASKLKGSRVKLYCFYYPETHSNRAEIVVFEKIADRIILI
jgi:hypothetical protein